MRKVSHVVGQCVGAQSLRATRQYSEAPEKSTMSDSCEIIMAWRSPTCRPPSVSQRWQEPDLTSSLCVTACRRATEASAR